MFREGDTIKVGQKILTLEDGRPDEAAEKTTDQEEPSRAMKQREAGKQSSASIETESESKETEESTEETSSAQEKQPAGESAAEAKTGRGKASSRRRKGEKERKTC